MIRPKVCFASLAVVQDATTNSISVFNILEGIVPSALPLLLQNVSFFVLWERDLTDAARVQATFTVRNDDLALTTQQIILDFADKRNHRTIANMNGLIVPRSGYAFELSRKVALRPSTRSRLLRPRQQFKSRHISEGKLCASP